MALDGKNPSQIAGNRTKDANMIEAIITNVDGGLEQMVSGNDPGADRCNLMVFDRVVE